MTVDYELDGHIAVITINRPEARNAVNGDVAEGIEAAVDQLEDDDEAWVGIITGARTDKGFIFSAGADLKEMTTDAGGHDDEEGRLRRARAAGADEADHRRGRRARAGRRHRDRPGLRPGGRVHAPPCSASPR